MFWEGAVGREDPTPTYSAHSSRLRHSDLSPTFLNPGATTALTRKFSIHNFYFTPFRHHAFPVFFFVFNLQFWKFRGNFLDTKKVFAQSSWRLEVAWVVRNRSSKKCLLKLPKCCYCKHHANKARNASCENIIWIFNFLHSSWRLSWIQPITINR